MFSHEAKRWNPRQPRWGINRFARSKFNLPRLVSEKIAMTRSSTAARAARTSNAAANLSTMPFPERQLNRSRW
jgi:hypothetical protein